MNTKKAQSGAWLTQIELDDEQNRSFVKEVSSFGTLANWRDATDSEKLAWEQAHPIEEMPFEE